MRTILKTLAFFFLITLLTGCSEDTIDETGEGTLTGKVVTASGNQPLENVKISTTPISTTVFTDSEGAFVIDNLATGEYSVQAELDAFVTAFEGANIQDARTVNVVFELDSVASKNLAPKRPILISPEDGEDDLNTTVEFIWSSSDNDGDEVSYRLEIRNGTTNEMMTFEEIKDTVYTVNDLQAGANYIWQVTANDGINDEVSSALAGFRTLNLAENRVFFNREVNGNSVIFSSPGTDANPDSVAVFRLTPLDKNSFRPRKNSTAGKVAFLRSVGAETHLFTMNSDGSGVRQVTRDIPVAGFNLEEIDFTWFDNGARLYYPNFDKLYAINADGTGVELVYTEPSGNFITEVAGNAVNKQLVIKTNNSAGYNARIVVIDPDTDTEVAVVAEGFSGAMGGLDFSIGGTRVLYTRDISGSENAQYRQLNTYIFQHDLVTGLTTQLQMERPAGTLDLDPRYAPNDGAIIFMNTSNDGISRRDLYRVVFDAELNRELIFEDASMPDWE
ncbi:carboxypeptidase regulatory-like domain-containing protein [Robertkochia flava]|uniref:carboxypeptidase regulatory-like domain-containing protein n=1 Tax=Robertkochia flava TaxID=3447986 RepID=UPI001CCB2966|nr:carboxypeptidase regulatory-like domain-containing protein [Robertkochia marina]